MNGKQSDRLLARRIGRLGLGLAFAIALVGCAPAPTPTPQQAAAPAPERSPQAGRSEVSGAMGAREVMVERAKADAATRAGVPASRIQVLSAEEREWPDRGLGCPEQGMMYAQVITPGFLILLEAGGRRFEYHTDQSSKLVLCENGRPV